MAFERSNFENRLAISIRVTREQARRGAIGSRTGSARRDGRRQGRRDLIKGPQITTDAQLFHWLFGVTKERRPEKLYEASVAEFTDTIIQCLLQGRHVDEVKYPTA
jgi:hypothetical protein